MILVTGSTGTVGKPLVGELRARGARVRALVRPSNASARDFRQNGVEVALGSFDDVESIRSALQGVDRLYLLSPPGTDEMVRVQNNVIDLATEAGVSHVVKQSSIAADESRDAEIIDAHRKIEEHLEASGLAWTHLRPNWFMQNELGQAATVMGEGRFYAPDITRISLIDARDVAAVAATVLTETGHENKEYTLTGPEPLSYGDIAQIYSTVLGRPVEWHQVSFDQAERSMRESGLSRELAHGFVEIMQGYRLGGVTSQVSSRVEEILRRDAHSFEDFVRDHLAVYRHEVR